jgi:hypothetical protein
VAKYSLELLYELITKEKEKSVATSRDEAVNSELVSQSIRNLLPQLQNPSLLLSMLSDSNYLQSKRLVEDEIQNFVKILSAQRTESRDILQRSFQLYTPLNLSLLPLLKTYVSLSSLCLSTSSSTNQPKMSTYSSVLTAIPSDAIPSIPSSKMEIYIRECPEILLAKLEQFLGIDSKLLENLSQLPPPNNYKNFLSPFVKLQLLFYSPDFVTYARPVSTSQSAAQYSHLYFELMVKLYFILKPHLLVSFVDFVHFAATETPAYGRSVLKESHFYIRALAVLPPPPLLCDNKSTTTVQVNAIISLFDRAGQSSRALRLLLSLGEDYWPAALKFVEAHQNQHTEHFELFHVLLFHCLDKMQTLAGTSQGDASDELEPQRIHEKLAQVWSLRPQKFSALDFLSILKSVSRPNSDESLKNTQNQQQNSLLNISQPFLDQKFAVSTVKNLRAQLMSFAVNTHTSPQRTDQSQTSNSITNTNI